MGMLHAYNAEPCLLTCLIRSFWAGLMSERLERNVMKKMSNLSLILSFSLLCGSLEAGQSGAAFLKIDPSAKAYAMGRVNVVSALGSQAIGANPANLQHLNQKYEFFSVFSNMLGGAQYGHGAIAMKMGDRIPYINSLGLSFTRLSIGGLEGRDSQGIKTTKSLGAEDTAIGLSASGKTKSGVELGATVKSLHSSLAGYKSNSVMAMDAGLGYTVKRFSKPVRLGMSINNAGQGMKFINQTDPLPTTINVGVGLEFGIAKVNLGASRMMEDGKMTPSLGMELNFTRVALRAGYRARVDGRNLALDSQSTAGKLFNGFTTGLGLNLGKATLDYALGQQAVEYGMTHRIALTIGWGK